MHRQPAGFVAEPAWEARALHPEGGLGVLALPFRRHTPRLGQAILLPWPSFFICKVRMEVLASQCPDRSWGAGRRPRP